MKPFVKQANITDIPTYMLGFALGSMIDLALTYSLRHGWSVAGMLGLGTAGGVIVGSIAERKGKVKSIKELHRPLTLFPPDPRQR
jgi:hypothetical protein